MPKLASHPSSASIRTIDFNYDDVFNESLDDLNADANGDDAANSNAGETSNSNCDASLSNLSEAGGSVAAGRRNSLHNSVTCDGQQAGETVAEAAKTAAMDRSTGDLGTEPGCLGEKQGSFSKDKPRKRGAWYYLRGPLAALLLAAVFGTTFYVGHIRSRERDAQATSGYAVIEGLTDVEAADAASNARSEPNKPPPIQEMPYPKASGGGDDKYKRAFPNSLEHNTAETISLQYRSEEVPLLFAAGGSGGDVVEKVLGECYGLVSAGENGREMEWRDEALAVLDEGGRQFVNVDLQSDRGIDRASSLGLASSGLVDYVSSSSLLYRAISSLFSANDPPARRRGRMGTILRHPVDRALERYYEVRAQIPALASMTAEEYAASDLVEDNLVTRLLSGHVDDDVLGGPLGKAHVDLAKEVLRRKALILLHSDTGKDVTSESLRRAERYFGWEGRGGSTAAGCQSAVLNDHRSVEAGKAVEYGPPPQVGEPAYVKILDRNKLDLELYEYAEELFAAQADLPARDAEPSEIWQWSDRNCIENGRFSANPPVSNWYAVQSNLQVVAGRNGKGNALKAADRGHQIFGGMWQNIEAGCLRTGEWYEVQATVRATMRGTDDEIFECDPTILYNNIAQSCPAVGVRVGDKMKEVGLTMGPVSARQEWIEMYGVFRATSVMTAKTVSTFVSRAPPDVDLAVDSIRISPTKAKTVGVTDCDRPIANGDAEAGDHRFWFIRGTQGGGRVEMVSPGHGGSKYAFRHSGQREQRYRGMLQRLDASCFMEGTTWAISARFRYFSVDGNTGEIKPAACRKDNPKAKDSCPVFDMDFVSPNGAKVNTGPLSNMAPGDVRLDDWNEIRHTVTVTPDMALRPQVLIYVNSVDPKFNYDLDDISMERINA